MLDLEIFQFEKMNWIKKIICFFKSDPELNAKTKYSFLKSTFSQAPIAQKMDSLKADDIWSQAHEHE